MNAEAIKAICQQMPLRSTVVRVDGNEFPLREMNGAERETYELLVSGKTDDKGKVIDPVGLRSGLLVRCMVDDAGQRVFGDHEAELINRLPGRVVQALFAAASELNSLGDEAKGQAAKN